MGAHRLTRTGEAEAIPAEADAGEEPTRKGRKDDRKNRGFLGFFRELPGLIIIAFLLALLIKTFLIQAFFIPSQSMLPTLKVGDRVLVNKLVYDFREPRRGEIIVFEDPNAKEPHRSWFSAAWHWVTDGLGITQNPEEDFIKRVIGLPGDTLEVRKGQVYIDGTAIGQPYVAREKDLSNFGPKTVPPGEFFVMGDNRANSQDSRSSLGTIPEDKIVGKAFVILWPPSHFEWSPEN